MQSNDTNTMRLVFDSRHSRSFVICVEIMKIIEYISETRAELRHVNWPTRKQVVSFTLLVAVFSLGVSFFLGFFYFLFTYILETFLI